MLILDNFYAIEHIKTRNDNESVYKAIRVSDSKHVIIKEFNLENEKSSIAYIRDVSVNIEHQNLNKLCESFKIENKGYVIREFLSGIDLSKALSKVKRREKTKFIINAAISTLQALQKLHENGIIHRDIRPANIVCRIDEYEKLTNEFVLIDFSTCYNSKLAEIEKYSPYALIFSPPEQILKFNDLLAPSSDIYALGVTLWSLFTNRFPFVHKIPEVTANMQITYPLQYDRKIPNEIFKIIQKATAKYQFPKPFKYYSREELSNMLKIGQSSRYQTTEEMIQDLEKCR